MCTRALWQDAAGAVLVGRNMDYGRELASNLWTFPAGIERDDRVDGTLTWRSKYGSLTVGGDDLMTVDGVNEQRLAGHMLVLSESDYGERDEGRPALAMSIWLQYILDNFASVAEAVEWTVRSGVQIVPQVDPASGRPIGLHLALEDGSGDSAVIEYLDGAATIHHGREYTVMTNSPPYDQQLELLGDVAGLGAERPLPGSNDPEDRFARAAYYLTRLPAPASTTEAVAALLSVMRNAAQPFRIPDPEKPYASQTIWRSIIDLTNGIYVFESASRPNIVWARLDGLELDEGETTSKLDLAADAGLEGGFVGDVTDDFAAAARLQFLPAG